MSEPITPIAPVVTAPVVETAPAVVETPAAPVVVAPVALSAAASRIAALRTSRAEARAALVAPVAEDKATPEVFASAKRWASHEASERKRITAASTSLSAEDRAIVEGERDVARASMLLARLSATAPTPTTKSVAPARANGAPPSAGAVDYAATLKDPKAMAEAKAKDPKGFADFFSSLVQRTSGRKSTLDIARAPKRA